MELIFMTDLMQALYTFAQKNHAAKHLSCDMEYQDSVDCARKGEQDSPLNKITHATD